MSVYTGADIIQENAICTQTHYCLLSVLQSEQCQKGTEARWSTVCFAAAAAADWCELYESSLSVGRESFLLHEELKSSLSKNDSGKQKPLLIMICEME